MMYKHFFKPLCDFLLALIALPFLLLLIVPIAIVIKCEDGGSVFYCGLRIGKNGKLFKMIKFRSMKMNAPDIRLADGSTFNGEDDPRVTKIGKFLRKTSLDEIPQIFNILGLQMSFIGPRPDPPDWLERYEERDTTFLSVKPGITGYNQAYFRNEADGDTKIENDNYYAAHMSLILDIKILFKTILTVFRHENVYVDEQRAAKTEESEVDETRVDSQDDADSAKGLNDESLPSAVNGSTDEEEPDHHPSAE